MARENTADRTALNTSIAAASQPSELQKAEEDANLDFINWEGGKGKYEGKPIDVMDAPSMGPSLSLFRRAKEGQTGERAGIGALRLGLNASDPGMAANLAEQSKLHREQDAAGALEEAVAAKSAEAHNSAIPLIQLDQSRALGIAGLRAGQAGQSQGLWAQYRVRPGLLPGMLNSAAQGAGQAATMFA